MDSMTFILFGATGDLAKRKIYPALYNLFLEGKLPNKFSVVGLGRKEVSNEEFRARLIDSLTKFSRKKPNKEDENFSEFVNSFQYSSLNVLSLDDYRKLLSKIQKHERELGILENRMFYLAVSPEFFSTIAENIKDSGLGDTEGWKRLIIEKPFGNDLKTAQELNLKLNKGFKEEEIYRIDHYLGKGMIQNLGKLRASNALFKHLWNNKYIDNIQITASETVGVEDRAGYYDQSGALRDMVQNHLLQMLMMVAMDQPEKLTTNAVHEEKKKVIDSLRNIDIDDVKNHIIRGQYGKGEVNGNGLVGYKEEPGVNLSSKTETFVAARLFIDNQRWKDVPFYLRTGKRMAEKSTQIVIELKKSASQMGFPNEEPNLLIFHINPSEGLTFRLNSKNQLKDEEMKPVDASYVEDSKIVPDGYERLIYDAIRGDSTYFAHWDEVEGSWKWIDNVLNAFQTRELPFYEYSAGSSGPIASHKLLEENGHKWW